MMLPLIYVTKTTMNMKTYNYYTGTTHMMFIRFLCCLITVVSYCGSLCTETLEFDETYQQIIAQALEIKAADSEIAARGAEWEQASYYPNPALVVELDNLGSAHNCDSNELSVDIVQLIELGGKRSARMQVAAADQCAAQWKLEVLKYEIYIDLLHAFIDIAAAQERVTLAKELHVAANEGLICSTTQTSAGKTSLIDTKKAEIACKTANLFLTRQQRLLSQAKKKLLTFWSSYAPQIDGVNLSLYEITQPPDFEELVSSLQNNPELAQLRAEEILASKVVELERSNRIPDIAIQIGISTERYYRSPALNIGFEIPLPIWDRNSGNIARAKYEYNQASYNEMNATRHFKASLGLLYEEWYSSYEQAMTLKDTIIPHAEEAYQLALNGYREGKFTYPAMLDARIALFNIKQQYLDAVVEYHHKRADIMKLSTRSIQL